MLLYRKKRKIKVCESHLSEFYKALMDSNLSKVKGVEHELTSAEKCVACVYLLKAKGEARDEAEAFLTQEGFVRLLSKKPGVVDFWLVQILIFIIVLVVIIAVEFASKGLIKSFLGFKDQSNIFASNPFEWGAILIISLLVYFKLEK